MKNGVPKTAHLFLPPKRCAKLDIPKTAHLFHTKIFRKLGLQKIKRCAVFATLKRRIFFSLRNDRIFRAHLFIFANFIHLFCVHLDGRKTCRVFLKDQKKRCAVFGNKKRCAVLASEKRRIFLSYVQRGM